MPYCILRPTPQRAVDSDAGGSKGPSFERRFAGREQDAGLGLDSPPQPGCDDAILPNLPRLEDSDSNMRIPVGRIASAAVRRFLRGRG